MQIAIDKQLIKQQFPKSMFKQLPKPTVSKTALKTKPGDWVWTDGKGNTFCRSGIVAWCAAEKPSIKQEEAMYEVFLHLSQLNGEALNHDVR